MTRPSSACGPTWPREDGERAYVARAEPCPKPPEGVPASRLAKRLRPARGLARTDRRPRRRRLRPPRGRLEGAGRPRCPGRTRSAQGAGEQPLRRSPLAHREAAARRSTSGSSPTPTCCAAFAPSGCCSGSARPRRGPSSTTWPRAPRKSARPRRPRPPSTSSTNAPPPSHDIGADPPSPKPKSTIAPVQQRTPDLQRRPACRTG